MMLKLFNTSGSGAYVGNECINSMNYGTWPSTVMAANSVIVGDTSDYTVTGGTYYAYYSSFNSSPYFIMNNASAKLDGLIIKTDNGNGKFGTISQQDDLVVKHCTFQDISYNNYYTYTTMIDNDSDYDTTITNCKFLDLFSQISLTTNDADIQQNIFFNMFDEYAVSVDGNGANITFDHNSFFNCYGGIELLNNDGNELIKNSIFHECVNYDVKAGTTLECTNICQTGSLSGVTKNSASITTNPRFINEGLDYTTNLDMNLQSIGLGHGYTSNCILLASDSKDIGAYDRSIAYVADTYSTVYIQKPDQIDIEYQAVNSASNTNLDGTTRTYRDGVSKEMVLKWSGILNEDYEDLLAFWYNHSGLVKVYLDPDTNPLDYEMWYLDFKNIAGSPKKSILLSETGVTDVEITLIKAYTG